MAPSEPSRWRSVDLDAMRRVGDPLADGLVDEIFEAHAIEGVRDLLSHCVDNAHPLRTSEGRALPPHLLAHVRRYFERSEAEAPALPPEPLAQSQDLFARVGPEILLILAAYSLPAAYAAQKGVQVLTQTNRLGSDTNRRLFETTQMVIDVLRPGGLDRAETPENHGVGIRTAQKVRLMHAAVRRMIRHHRGETFVAAYGVPINQEDLAGTLMTFSWIVLDGLDRMEIATSPEERKAYLETWLYVGRILGVKEELFPRSVEEARALTDLIHERQIRPSAEGRYMTRALLDMMRGHLPWFLHGLPPALLWFFLRENARVIAVPRAGAAVFLVRGLVELARVTDRLFGQGRFFPPLYRRFNLAFMQGMVERERGPGRPRFEIPAHLAQRWPDVPRALHEGAR